MPPFTVTLPETVNPAPVVQVGVPVMVIFTAAVVAQVLAADEPARAKVEYVVAAQVWAAPL